MSLTTIPIIVVVLFILVFISMILLKETARRRSTPSSSVAERRRSMRSCPRWSYSERNGGGHDDLLSSTRDNEG
jgi:hypothetical protein